uniref:ZT_dimer domain-containing protein n=1 Tax=Panagrellus redivivus TaxID=6233 RepID=A0A7E4W845_PANRE
MFTSEVHAVEEPRCTARVDDQRCQISTITKVNPGYKPATTRKVSVILTMVQAWTPYLILLSLAIAQVCATLQTHSLVARLVLCDTTLFVIVMARRLFTKAQENLDLFLRLAGVIAFEALIFVNFTHGLEVLFVEHHDTHMSHIFVIVTLFDVAIKTAFLTFGVFPTLGLTWPRRAVLHYLASFTALALAALDYFYKNPSGVSYLARFDPYCCGIICILLSCITIPIMIKIIPYLLGDIPVSFNVSEFTKTVQAKFPNVSCRHIHAFRQWPNDNFEVIMHVEVSVDQTNADWRTHTQTLIQQMQSELKGILVKAHRITIEPIITNSNASRIDWSPCKERLCETKNMTCCEPHKHLQKKTCDKVDSL